METHGDRLLEHILAGGNDDAEYELLVESLLKKRRASQAGEGASPKGSDPPDVGGRP